MESKKGVNQSMSRSVVPLVDELEDEYGSISKVPETNKKLLEIRKRLNLHDQDNEQKQKLYEAIKHSLNLGQSVSDIAKKNNVSRSVVYRIQKETQEYNVRRAKHDPDYKPCVLINKKTGERINFKAIKYIGPAMGRSEAWGYLIRKGESPTYRIELLPKEKKDSKT